MTQRLRTVLVRAAVAGAVCVACACSSSSSAPSSGGKSSAKHADGGSGASGSSAGDAGAGKAGASAPSAKIAAPEPIPLAGLEMGNGFDDLRYSADQKKILAPGNYSGNVYLIDPETLAAEAISGFSSDAMWNGGDMQGAASLDAGDGFIFVADRTATKLYVVDAATKKIVASAALGSYPDYLRYFAPTREVWVTEPFSSRVEVLSIPASGTPTPQHEAFVMLGGFPEGIGFDAKRKLAFSQTVPGLGNSILVMDIETHMQTATWDSGCDSGGTHGNPLADPERGQLFAACSDATVVVLDLDHDGQKLDAYTLGSGSAIPAYAPALHHFYLRGDPGLPIAVLDVAADGKLTLLGQVDAVDKAHCLAADEAHHFFTCDWQGGQVLRFTDPY